MIALLHAERLALDAGVALEANFVLPVDGRLKGGGNNVVEDQEIPLRSAPPMLSIAAPGVYCRFDFVDRVALQGAFGEFDNLAGVRVVVEDKLPHQPVTILVSVLKQL